MHGPAKANTRPFNVKIHRDSVYLPNGVVDISATHGSVALIGRGAINNCFWAASCCLCAGDKAARPLTSLAGVRVWRKRSLAASRADARIGRAGGVLSV